MNILEVQEALKDMSQKQLLREAKQPSGVAPSFMVVSELKRRQDMRQRYQGQAPKATVTEEVVGRSMQPMMPQQMSQPMPQQMPQQMPMQQPMMQPQMRQTMMQEEPRRMAVGGILRGLGSIFSRRGAQQARTTRMPIQPQSGGTNMPMAPINPSNLPVPYAPPATTQRGLGALGGVGKTLAGATPVGLGAYAMMPDTMGDGTMAGMYGLSEEDFQVLVQEAEKRGITPYDERFAELVAASKGQDQQMSREEMLAQMQERGQETKAESAERPKSYLEQLKENVEQREERGRRLGLAQLGLEIASRAGEGKPFLTSVSEAGLAALPQFQKAGDARTKMLSALADAEMKSKSGGADLGDLIKYREDISKTLNDPVLSNSLTEDEKQTLRARLSEIDSRIQRSFGISGTTDGGQQSFTDMVVKALQSKQQS